LRLKLLIEHVVTVQSEKLCHHLCEGAEAEYPLGHCNLFGAKRELSESEDVGAYLRLPACVAQATERHVPWMPEVGTEMVFDNTGTRHRVAEVRTESEDSGNDYAARLDPPLPAPYARWEWVTDRYLSRVES
jgi:hypothetical protein